VPEMIGTVDCIRVGDDFGFTTIVDNTGDREIFILWWSGLATPLEPRTHVRIVQSDWIAMLRQAMSDQSRVTITHGTNSSVVLNVQLNA